jgi:hypothetical protein
MVVAAGMDSFSLQDLQQSKLCIKSMIAQGGFATCYRATYEGEAVAVKVIPRHADASDQHSRYCRQAFFHECLLVAGLKHEYAPRAEVYKKFSDMYIIIAQPVRAPWLS